MTGFASKRVMAMGRQHGKSTYAHVLKKFYDMQPPTKIIWHTLPGRKLKATWQVGPRGWESFGLKESDIDPIQQWCTENRCGKRISFDTFIFKEDKQITMFLLRWSS
jgi:hypothetical protein